MNSDLRKKLLFFGGIGVGAFILILLIMWIVSLITGGRTSYNAVENKMRDAAIKYYEANKKDLPSSGGQVTIDAATLSAQKYMKPLEKLVSKKVSCTGKVVVKENEGTYLYTPYLSCGDDYTTVELYKKIIDQSVVTAGDGLYQMNGEYVFRGEKVNNYVQSGKNVWQITKITKDNQIQLIYTEDTELIQWDDRYNGEISYNSGINNYSLSRIKDSIGGIYSSDEYSIFDDNIKSKMTKFNLCAGKRNEIEAVNDGSIECANVVEKQLVGLLPINEYINASLDSSCTKIEDDQCQNYNYLVRPYIWWTVTANKDDTYKVYQIESGGSISILDAASYSNIRPIIRLSSSVIYSSGSGTEQDPYILD